jgi:hypothetical protein
VAYVRALGWARAASIVATVSGKSRSTCYR